MPSNRDFPPIGVHSDTIKAVFVKSAMSERSPRINIGLPESILEKLERLANYRGTKPATEAAYIITRYLDELEEQGKLPQKESQPTYQTLRELILHRQGELYDVPVLRNRLPEIRDGSPPTNEEILQICIALDLSGKYVSDLANKERKGNGTTRT